MHTAAITSTARAWRSGLVCLLEIYTQVRRIEDPKHPACGQYGLFATEDWKPNERWHAHCLVVALMA